ncbi:ATP-binding protein [Flagellimonas sp. DF-77]|uniref:AlbA family DNA-binding domain-containing protein n=1 Tax=Flagellimonas algarum TaxID=3230298 RepID=UPI003399EBF5
MENNHKYFISKIFGVDDDELTISQVQDFFKYEQQETSILEFKSGTVDVDSIYKEVTAFLNTEGGLLIIGAPVEKTKTSDRVKVTFCQGSLTQSKFKSKDWLVQKIATNIIPSPISIKVKELEYMNGKIFLVDVPQSVTPPHQSSLDKRYYIRLDSETKPAPHGIVAALFDKRRAPELDTVTRIDQKSDNVDLINIGLTNVSVYPADKAAILIDVYNVIQVVNNRSFRLIDGPPKERRYSLTKKFDTLIVQRITQSVSFRVVHKNEDYFINLSYWCKQRNVEQKLLRYSVTERMFFEVDTGSGGRKKIFEEHFKGQE